MCHITWQKYVTIDQRVPIPSSHLMLGKPGFTSFRMKNERQTEVGVD